MLSDEKAESEEDQEPPFELRNLMFSVPKGSFVAIVGRVGSGKVHRFDDCWAYNSSDFPSPFRVLCCRHLLTRCPRQVVGYAAFDALFFISYLPFSGYFWWEDCICSSVSLDSKRYYPRKYPIW